MTVEDLAVGCCNQVVKVTYLSESYQVLFPFLLSFVSYLPLCYEAMYRITVSFICAILLYEDIQRIDISKETLNKSIFAITRKMAKICCKILISSTCSLKYCCY